MIRVSFYIVGVLSLLSCNESLYIDQIDRSKFCEYFEIQTGNYVLDGKNRLTASTQINYIPNDNVSDFIQNHYHRFDYIINKQFTSLIKINKNFDSSSIKVNFCNHIVTDSFYQQFLLLTSGERSNKKDVISFSVSELMMIASRFFMCDNIKEKDTSISYHICVGINGIPELQTKRDYTALEAFCFEAIFTNLVGKPKFITNFNSYISQSSKKNKLDFIDFDTHLAKVKFECYAKMEIDKELKKVLLKYYEENMTSINFKIE